MKLNNKGFAITSVLYGLLILFVLLVGSYLTILLARKNRQDKITEEIEKDYYFSNSSRLTIDDITSFEAPITGKYVIDYDGNTEDDCYIYLGKGSTIDTTKVIGDCTISNGTKVIIYY